MIENSVNIIFSWPGTPQAILHTNFKVIGGREIKCYTSQKLGHTAFLISFVVIVLQQIVNGGRDYQGR